MYRLHRMDLSDPHIVDKANQISWVTINRVCGEISVSRSIGDPDYKRFTPGGVVSAPFNWPDNHNQIFHADLLIPDPECRVHDIEPADEFLVLASDGLWDVVSPAEAVKMIR
jgi:serine/threonine protein phosphatase PrpC